jgi:hypothetical protein
MVERPARHKHSSLYGPYVSKCKNGLVFVYETVSLSSIKVVQNKLECFSLVNLFTLAQYLRQRHENTRVEPPTICCSMFFVVKTVSLNVQKNSLAFSGQGQFGRQPGAAEIICTAMCLSREPLLKGKAQYS